MQLVLDGNEAASLLRAIARTVKSLGDKELQSIQRQKRL